jgi:hypothetical protein
LSAITDKAFFVDRPLNALSCVWTQLLA